MADNDFEIEAMGDVYAQALVNLAVKADALAEIPRTCAGWRR